VLRQDYIRTAWAKGLRERAVIIRHALKNACIPVVTIIGQQFSVLLGGTVIVEFIFLQPGVGSLMLDAVLLRDYTSIQGAVLFFATVIVVMNLLVDLSYAWFDPRIRYS
jgi:peptide/nickel transport system permease protein